MLKKLVKLAILLVVIVLIGAVVAFVYVDSIAKAAIEKGGTYALGVNTTLGSADIGVFSGDFAMNSLKVANPEGFKSDSFLSLGDGSVKVSLGSLREEVIELPRLSLDALTVNLEKKDGQANYDVILANLKRFESADDGGAPTEEAGGKKFVIREVVISNVVINAEVLPLGGELSTVKVPIDEITMKNVGESGVKGSGLTLGELTALIVKTVFAAAIENGAGILPADLMNGLTDQLKNLDGLGNVAVSIGGEALQNVGSMFGNVGGALEDVGGEVGETINEGLKGVGEGLGNLLGGGENEGTTEEGDGERRRRRRDGGE
jgi:hypothetical protein